jgi:ABC-type glycerol-3-phosphate transport system substrate-binding protein
MDFPVPDGKNGENPSGSLVSSMVVLFYNIELLEAAGIDRPPKTREDLEKLAESLAEKNRAVLSLALAAEAYTDIYPWFWAAGERIFPGDGAGSFAGPGFDRQNSIAVLSWLALLSEKGYLAPNPFTKTAAGKRDDFRAGRAAMMLAPVSEARELRKAGVRFDITTVPVPASYRDRPVFGLEGWTAGVARTSRRKADARAFVAFLAAKAPRLAAAWGAVPGDTTQGTYAGDDPLLAKAYSIYEAGESLEDFAARDGAARLDAAVIEEFRALFAGRQGAEDTARAITERWHTAAR